MLQTARRDVVSVRMDKPTCALTLLPALQTRTVGLARHIHRLLTAQPYARVSKRFDRLRTFSLVRAASFIRLKGPVLCAVVPTRSSRHLRILNLGELCVT